MTSTFKSVFGYKLVQMFVSLRFFFLFHRVTIFTKIYNVHIQFIILLYFFLSWRAFKWDQLRCCLRANMLSTPPFPFACSWFHWSQNIKAVADFIFLFFLFLIFFSLISWYVIGFVCAHLKKTKNETNSTKMQTDWNAWLANGFHIIIVIIYFINNNNNKLILLHIPWIWMDTDMTFTFFFWILRKMTPIQSVKSLFRKTNCVISCIQSWRCEIMYLHLQFDPNDWKHFYTWNK